MSTTFKLTTWNIENLFRPLPTAPKRQRLAYDAKLAFLAGTLDTLTPDVVALQEVGSPQALTDLRNELRNSFPFSRVGIQDGRGISVAFLSKLPFHEEQDITLFPEPVASLSVRDLNGRPCPAMGRGALRVRVTKGSFTTDLLNVHLKSKLLSFPSPNGGTAFSTRDEDLRARVAAVALLRRAAEATTVRLAATTSSSAIASTPSPSSATSTTALPPPRRRSSKAPTAVKSTPPASTAPTPPTTPASGTWPRASLPNGAFRAFTMAKVSSSTRSSSRRSTSLAKHRTGRDVSR